MKLQMDWGFSRLSGVADARGLLPPAPMEQFQYGVIKAIQSHLPVYAAISLLFYVFLKSRLGDWFLFSIMQPLQDPPYDNLLTSYATRIALMTLWNV